jgi:serine/alanine adding enzyme
MKMNLSATRVDLWTDFPQRDAMRAYDDVVDRATPEAPCCDPRWLAALCRGLSHEPYLLVATQGGQPVGVLPLAFVKSRLFGRFLVSLPYVNSAGVVAEDEEVAVALIDRAIALADELDVRHLELRHERPVKHPALRDELTSKVLMRLPLPDSTDALRKDLKSKVRNKVRKGERQGFAIHWGGLELLADFYAVFSRNMRDLGTPVFGIRLFRAILTHFPDEAELCVVRAGRQPIAAGLLVHGNGTTEVPSASSLRDFNSTNANDLMYWHLLRRAVERGQRLFDFGRSTLDGNTFVFKKKWGARPEPTVWQYYTRKGTAADFRPDNGNYDRLIAIWRHLPVWTTRLIGPSIVRGIP